MYATLAYGSSLLGWMMNKYEGPHTTEYFLDKTLQSVRTRLSNPNCVVDDWFILSLYALAVTEMWNGFPNMWRGNPQRFAMVSQTSQHGLNACRMHLGAIISLVDKAQGWGAFNPYVLDSVLLADKYLALNACEEPLIPFTWGPGSLSSAKRAELEIRGESLPQLGRRLLNENMSEKMRETLYDLVEYCRIAHEAWLQEVVGAEVESWLFRRLQAISYRLLFLYNIPNADQIDRCICLATLVFILGSTVSKGPRESALSLVKRVKAQLQESWQQTAAPNGELLFWCLCTVGMVCDPGPDRQWFIQHAVRTCTGQLEYQQIEEKLELFLYLSKNQRDLLVVFAQELEETGRMYTRC